MRKMGIKRVVMSAVLLLVLASCRENRREMLVGKWQSTKIESTDVKSYFANMQQYIDTMGKRNDVALNISIYGTANVDSLRDLMKEKFEMARRMQHAQDSMTTFEFKKDSVAELTFSGSESQKGKWYIDKNGNLVLLEMDEHGVYDASEIKILKLTPTALELEFTRTEENVVDTSHVTFARAKK